MIKSGHVAASRVIKIIKTHIVKETAEDVINDNSRFIPAILKKYVPEETYEQHNADLFIIMLQILESKKFDASESTKQLITRLMIDSAENDDHSKHIFRMFNENAVLNLNGDKIEGVTLTTPQKHDMVKVIYSSKALTMDEKKQSMDMLAKIDQSDKLGLTQQFCISAVPEIENKRAVWARLFDSGNENKLSLYQTEELCLGFRQYSQRDMVVEFREDFFNKIDNVIKTMGKNIAESYWYYL